MDHTHQALSHSWSVFYVVLSYVIATLASYVSLEVATRAGQRSAEGHRGRAWLLAQAALLGYGIWAMHFVGMLAYQVSATVTYNLPLTVLSGVLAIGLMYPALLILHGGPLRLARLLLAGLVAGSGIVFMHYLGMFAFQVPGTAVSVRPVPLVLSVLIAVGASMAAFYLFRLVSSTWARKLSGAALTGLKVAAGLVMGGAIVSMHYTGMAAWHLNVVDGNLLYRNTGGLDTEFLALGISVLSIVLLSVTGTKLLMDAVLEPTPAS
ncbi:MHYT domain-containing protein [Deinococcus planocerae]|uniref:MHYT domain-containing protein n=1 Tax=Deinococcus planocerae TaxID=1737569 RepID=UPI000C7F3896|nr:MHYT domain-containing protein [Deinococcus planocerae]